MFKGLIFINKVFCGFLVVFCGPSSLWHLTFLQLFLFWIMALLKPLPKFCYKYFFNDKLLASEVTCVVQQPINSWIASSRNFVPSTNVPMSKDHENIVAIAKNKKTKHAKYDTHCKFPNIKVAKYNWVENVVGEDGLVFAVRWKVE